MTRLAHLIAAGALALAATQIAVAGQTAPTRYAGRPLIEVLQDLDRQGLSIVYSSGLVKSEWRVGVEPHGNSARTILDEVLAPHGLAVQQGPRGTLLIVAAKPRVESLSSTRAMPAPEPVAAPPIRHATTLPELLAASGAYLQMFVQRFANVVAREEYVQERTGGLRSGKHALTSDFFLITLPGSADWIECRDVYEADGKPVGDRETRLLKMLQNGSPKDWTVRAAAVARESTRFNLDDMGTINRPLVTLALMQGALQPRLTFANGAADATGGPGVSVVAFQENAGWVPMFEQSPLWGRVWVDASTGMILKTELLFGNRRSPNRIVTTFSADPLLGVAVPIDMTEQYYPGSLREIRGHATYANFRHFGVKTETSLGTAQP